MGVALLLQLPEGKTMNKTPGNFRRTILGLWIGLLIVPGISLAIPDQIPPVPAPTSIAFDPVMTNTTFGYGEIIPITTEIQK